MASELLNRRDLTGDAEGTEAIRQNYSALYKSFADGIGKLQNELKEKRAGLTTAEGEWAAGFMQTPGWEFLAPSCTVVEVTSSELVDPKKTKGGWRPSRTDP